MLLRNASQDYRPVVSTEKEALRTQNSFRRFWNEGFIVCAAAAANSSEVVSVCCCILLRDLLRSGFGASKSEHFNLVLRYLFRVCERVEKSTPVILAEMGKGSSGATFWEVLLAILLPPLGVFFRYGCGLEFWICVLLTILGYIPGILYALYVIVA